MQIGNVLVAIGSLGVMGGLTILFGDPANKLIGGIMGFIGLLVIIGGYTTTQTLDHSEKRYRKSILSEMQTISSNISNLVEEIRTDRQSKNDKGK